ncbi:MAG: thiamine phosphate synthase [Gammaproteobacteria bacterium]|nr:thiamine phosphate synthase [Gammaproteobacteria bacterium]
MKAIKTPDSPLRGLYAIVDTALLGENLLSAVGACLQGGCRLIQYRDKSNNAAQRKLEANALLKLCREFNALLIINDDVQLAKTVAADGVHLGRDDSSINAARRLLGEKSIIGASCYNRLDLAHEAEKSGADYVAFGSVFSSPTKPSAVHAPLELINKARQTVSLPICAIGGITVNNAHTVIEAGADMLAVISEVFATAEIESRTRRLVNLIQNRNLVS